MAVGIGAVVGAAAMVVFGVTHTTPEVVAPHLDVTAAQYPHGDQVIVSWSGTDEHDDTTTRLTVDGQAPPRGCPRQITGSGSCTFTGGWRRTYTVGAFASSDKRSASSVDRTVTTMVEPSVDVHPGSTFVDSGTTYCSVLVTLRGFAPNTSYAGIERSDYTERTGRDPFTFTVATDSDGSLTDAETGWGYWDPDSQGWIEVTVDGHTGRDSSWGCP